MTTYTTSHWPGQPGRLPRPVPEQDIKLDAESLKLHRKLDDEGESGDASPDAIIGKGPDTMKARPVTQTRTFCEEINELHRLAVLLTAGCSTVLSPDKERQVSELSPCAAAAGPRFRGPAARRTWGEPGAPVGQLTKAPLGFCFSDGAAPMVVARSDVWQRLGARRHRWSSMAPVT